MENESDFREIDSDEGRDTDWDSHLNVPEPFYAEALPCESCGKPRHAPQPEPKPEHDFVVACPGGYLHKDGGEACQFNDTDLILIVGQMEAEDLCAGRKDTHRAVKVSVYFDRIERGWK